jgi:hypothetical protein
MVLIDKNDNLSPSYGQIVESCFIMSDKNELCLSTGFLIIFNLSQNFGF